jgi:hypothetical protein
MSAKPKYQLLPPLSEAEFEALREDIAVQGVLIPIDVDEHGDILDGHHRKQACDELGIDCPTRVVPDIPDFAKADYALTVNLSRRHLDRAQRRQLVWNSVKDAPHLSDRQHARRCGVSPTTVADVRKDLEAVDEVSKLDTRTDRRGREQPASKPKIPAADPSPAAGGADEPAPPAGSSAPNPPVGEPPSGGDSVYRRPEPNPPEGAPSPTGDGAVEDSPARSAAPASGAVDQQQDPTPAGVAGSGPAWEPPTWLLAINALDGASQLLAAEDATQVAEAASREHLDIVRAVRDYLAEWCERAGVDW